MIQEMRVDGGTLSSVTLTALSRAYLGPAGPLTFFVAFFKSQRGGVTPHSPKICLPGAS